MKYISIDLETTGLDPENNQILEFGAVLDDLKNPLPLKDLPRYHCYITRETYVGSAFALALNHNILRNIAMITPGYQYLREEQLGVHFTDFLCKNGYPSEYNKITINAAGKNFATFDYQFLKKTSFNDYIKVSHRVLDPSILYLNIQKDDRLPATKECFQRAGITKEVSHTAIEDALDIIKLIRHKYGIEST